MSKWTHIAGIIRIDQLPIGMTQEDIINLLQTDAPSGSEGGLRITADRTQTNELVWGSVMFVGDLRDFEDTKKVEDWLKQIPEKLRKHAATIRQAAINIDVEFGPCIGIVWNPRTDNFTVIDIPTGEEPIAPDKKSEGVFCCKCGKDITHEKQVGAGDGTGQRFQCESCYKKETRKPK